MKKAIPLQLEVVSTGSIHPCLESQLKYNYGYFLQISCKGRLAQLVRASWVRSPRWPFIFVVFIEIFTKYFFGAEEKVSQFVMHQFATFISLIFTTLLCISIELLNYLISFNQENVGSISKSNSSPT